MSNSRRKPVRCCKTHEGGEVVYLSKPKHTGRATIEWFGSKHLHMSGRALDKSRPKSNWVYSKKCCLFTDTLLPIWLSLWCFGKENRKMFSLWMWKTARDEQFATKVGSTAHDSGNCMRIDTSFLCCRIIHFS